jgi:hypothetical protein
MGSVAPASKPASSLPAPEPEGDTLELLQAMTANTAEASAPNHVHL